MPYYFRNRRDAGRQLAARLAPLRSERTVVLGLPRGGIPVAYEVARALGAPLDVVIVHKLGLLSQPELGMGAIGEGGTPVLNQNVLSAARVTDRELATVEARERVEVDRRAQQYRGDRPMIKLRGRTVILVDDGLATGGTARAAIHVAREQGASRVILAVPVAPPDSLQSLAADADEVVALYTPSDFRSLGQWSTWSSPIARSRKSAGILSPASMSTRSPGTNRSAGRLLTWPSRRTFALVCTIARSASSAASALDSCTNPTPAFMSTTPKMTDASTSSPRASVTIPALSRT